MSRPQKGARLYFRRESRKADGSLRSAAGWFVRDGKRLLSTGCGADDRAGAERWLADYLTRKHDPVADAGPKDEIVVADIINAWLRVAGSAQSRPAETAARAIRLLTFFGQMKPAEIAGRTCRDYAADRSAAAARRELEDLRAAFNWGKREGMIDAVPAIVLPERPPRRERWLTRREAAALLRAAWRSRQKWMGEETKRRDGKHLARFILVALYTGSRAGNVCAASWERREDAGWIDLEAGLYYRKPPGSRDTKKRAPPVPLPDRLLAHMRRWRRIDPDATFVVEWRGNPVGRVSKSFRAARDDAKLGADVTPHVLRHTAATWLMQAGVDIWEAAGYLGMTVETLERNYGHHHPDYLRKAAAAIGRKPHRNPTD